MSEKPMPFVAADILNLLRARYSADKGWHGLYEMEWRGRRIDFAAIMLYASRGHAVHGMEIKVTRSDLAHEIENPQKAEGFWRFCDYFWLVVGDAAIVEGLDVPRTWGILAARRTVKGAGLRKVRGAAPLKPEPWTKGFMARLLLRTVAQGHDAVEKARGEGWKEGNEAGLKGATRNTPDVWRRLREIENRVEEFESASGISLGEYSRPTRIGRAVRVVLADDNMNWRNLAKRQAEHQRDLADVMERKIAEAEAELRGDNGGEEDDE